MRRENKGRAQQRGRNLGWMITTLVLLFVGSVMTFAQSGQLSVTASAGSPSPNPACIGEEVTASLTATVANQPQGNSTCSVNFPTWSWQVVSVQYQATQNSPSQPASSYSASIMQFDQSMPDATLNANFSVAGYYTLTLQATVQFTDTCNNTWSASGTTTVSVTAVSVTFSPSPVGMTPSSTASVTATVAPSDFTGSIYYSTWDNTVATVSGSAPTLTVTSGASDGTTTLQASLDSGNTRSCGDDMIYVCSTGCSGS